MNLIKIILGGPGAGKTEALLKIVEAELGAGVPPERIAFVAFTRAAASEAKNRAVAAGLDRKRLVWFRTLHSLAFEALGLHREDVMTRRHWTDLGGTLGLRFTGALDLLDGPVLPTDAEGDRLRALGHIARARSRSLEDVWYETGEGLAWNRVRQFEDALAAYKEDSGLVDFSDMLRLFVERGGSIDVDVAIIDEAQDLTTEQWGALEIAFAGAARVYVAGDDDQAIYQWAGADVDRFLHLESRRQVLPTSHRLPGPIFDLAGRVAAQITPRYKKKWGPAPHDGTVKRLVEPEMADLSKPGTWLLLARHKHQLKRLADLCRVSGVPYSVAGISAVSRTDVSVIRRYEALRAGKALPWGEVELVISAMEVDPYSPPDAAGVEDRPWTAQELGLDCGKIWHDALVGMDLDDREFYLACLRRDEDLIAAPRARVSTIHGAKGQEADNVLVVGDMSRRTWGGFRDDSSAEHRVFYVAATRARQALYLIYPGTARGYEWPA